MPKVSVIVPVYNAEKFLVRCLDSILGQSLHDIEVICVDDGSPDGSIDILRRYEAVDSRVKVIRQPNKKQGGARNTGLDAASGEYIGFVDSDDYIDAGFYERLCSAAERSGADVACCGIVKHRPCRDKYELRYSSEKTAVGLQDKFSLCSCPPQFYTMNKIYRRSMIEAHALRFREGVVFEDIAFVAQALYRASSVVSVPDTVYHYVYNGFSTINSAETPQKRLDRYNARKAFAEFADRIGLVLPRTYRNIPVRSFAVGPVCLLKIKERDGRRMYRLFDFLTLFSKRV